MIQKKTLVQILLQIMAEEYIKMNFHKFKYLISLNKTKFVRGYSYISAIGIPFLMARSLGEMIPNWSWVWFFIPVMLIVYLIGWVDWHYGFFGNELEIGLTQNPEWVKKMGKEKKRKRNEN